MKTLLQLLTEASARNETELGKMIRGTLFKANPKDLHVNLLVLADFLDEMGNEQASLISQLIRCVTEDEICGNVYDLHRKIGRSFAKVGYNVTIGGLMSINPPMKSTPSKKVTPYRFDKFYIIKPSGMQYIPGGYRRKRIAIWSVDNINYQLAFLANFVINISEQKGAINKSFGSESHYDNLVLKSLDVICKNRLNPDVDGYYNPIFDELSSVFRYVNGCIKRVREIPKEVMERMESCLDEHEYNLIVNAIDKKQLIDNNIDV